MLANLINDARRGDHNAVIMLGGMAEQMSMPGGDMAKVGAILKDLIDGERDVDKLCDKVGPQGESLIVQILEELGKLEVH
jgi:alanine-alpha-ketoisovalerate/valine-pyruvate aminotransferase